MGYVPRCNFVIVAGFMDINYHLLLRVAMILLDS